MQMSMSIPASVPGLIQVWDRPACTCYGDGGVDPFRARFLLGLNDGEWNQLDNWLDLFENPQWYAEIFEPLNEPLLWMKSAVRAWLLLSIRQKLNSDKDRAQY